MVSEVTSCLRFSSLAKYSVVSRDDGLSTQRGAPARNYGNMVEDALLLGAFEGLFENICLQCDLEDSVCSCDQHQASELTSSLTKQASRRKKSRPEKKEERELCIISFRFPSN